MNILSILVYFKTQSSGWLKVMGNRWSWSHEKINHFRTSLGNPLTSQMFRRYVSGQGDIHENDVLFWQEAEKYRVSRHVLLTRA